VWHAWVDLLGMLAPSRAGGSDELLQERRREFAREEADLTGGA
jgi:hypothetical protein